MRVVVETPWGETTTTDDPTLAEKNWAWSHFSAGHRYRILKNGQAICDTCGGRWPSAERRDP